MTFLVLHPRAETLNNDDPYGTFAWLSLSETQDFKWFSKHVSLLFVASVLDCILHRFRNYFGIYLASKPTFFLYRFSNNCFICFLTFWGTTNCSFGGAFGTMNVIKNRKFRKHASQHDFGPQKGRFGQPPGVPGETLCNCWEVLSCCWHRCLLHSEIFWRKLQSNFSAPNPFQHHNLWLARRGLALQLGYINY